MAITTNQLIADIRNIASSGSNPIEFRIEDSQILFWCNEIRAMLISQSIQKRQDITDIWVQTINCLELEQVDQSECCNNSTNCYILKSVQKLPRTIESYKDNTILKVSTIHGKVIPKSNSFKARYLKYNKYTKSGISWYIKNDYLYIENNAFIKYVNVDLIIEDPSELKRFNDCEGNSCFSYNSNYPVSLKMANDITNIVLKTKVLPYLQMGTDNKNDSSNETIIPQNIK